MKIMVLTDDFPPESRGGAGKIAASLALVYQQAGHEVEVVTTTRIKAHARMEQSDGITVYRIYSDYPERWRAYLSLFNPFVLNYLREIVYRMPPDIVHVHNIHESSAKSPNFTNPMPGVEAAGGPEVAIAAPESPE